MLLEWFTIIFICIIPLILIITVIVLFIQKKYKVAIILGSIVSILLILIIFIPFPVKAVAKDHSKELGEPWINGVWTKVYKNPDSHWVTKQLTSPGVTHTDYRDLIIPTPLRICKYPYCTIPVILAHKVKINTLWKTVQRMQKLQQFIPYFATVRDLDNQKQRYTQEFLPYNVTSATCPKNWKEQLIDFNRLLKKHNVYLDDVHIKNLGVSITGTLKVYDCNIYTPTEFKIQKWLYGKIKTANSRHNKKHYQNAPRIFYWSDKDFPSLEEVCARY